ncbi:unnamed protein product [Clonostachys byssicola]|uniref:Uncharacterized protein n=1 Tax=Clonostachys byssicola TaxID=160290 RepID=A0A9N9Y364_9HYPO|nr:unnamed protein product [Clonostachys byssicola]
MRFNIAYACAFLSITTPFVAAVKWNDQKNDKVYAYAASACFVGSTICSAVGQVAVGRTLTAASICCTVVGTTATADRNKEFEETKKRVGAAATLVKTKAGEYTDKTGKFIVDCKDKVCKLVAKGKGPILPRRTNDSIRKRRDSRRNERRSGYSKMKRSADMQVRSPKPMTMDY